MTKRWTTAVPGTAVALATALGLAGCGLGSPEEPVPDAHHDRRGPRPGRPEQAAETR